MNKFVKSEYDQLKQRRDIRLKDEIILVVKKGTMDLIYSKIDFRQVTIKDKDNLLVIDLTANSRNGVNISNGELQMVVDGEHYSLEPHESYSTDYLGDWHIESDFYVIDEAYLKSICDAKTLSVRVTNGEEYADFSSSIEMQRMQRGARVMYNALFDKTAYANEILAIPAQEYEQKHKSQEYEQKHKSGLIWTRVLGIGAIIVGWCLEVWWLIVIGIIAIGIYQFCYSKKKRDILNSTNLEK